MDDSSCGRGCAGNTKDVTVQTVQRGDLEELGGPKNMGGWWLHEKTLDMKPDVFAVISSSSADTTGRGMTVYAATNAMLNSLVRYRRSLGLPACSLSMCTLSDVGVVVNNPAVREMQVKAGYEMVPSDKAFEDLFEVSHPSPTLPLRPGRQHSAGIWAFRASLPCGWQVIVSGRPVVGHLQFEHGCTSHGRNAAAFYGGVRTPFVLGAAKGMKRYDTYEEILQFVMEQVSPQRREIAWICVYWQRKSWSRCALLGLSSRALPCSLHWLSRVRATSGGPAGEAGDAHRRRVCRRDAGQPLLRLAVGHGGHLAHQGRAGHRGALLQGQDDGCVTRVLIMVVRALCTPGDVAL